MVLNGSGRPSKSLDRMDGVVSLSLTFPLQTCWPSSQTFPTLLRLALVDELLGDWPATQERREFAQ